MFPSAAANAAKKALQSPVAETSPVARQLKVQAKTGTPNQS